MSREERINGLIRKWQARLRLQDWDIRFIEGPTDENCVANNDSWRLKQIAVIRVKPGLTPEAEEREVVHELLHTLLKGVREAWDNEAHRYMPPLVYAAVEDLATEHEEVVIEKLVCALTGTPYIAPPGCNAVYASAFPMGGQ